MAYKAELSQDKFYIKIKYFGDVSLKDLTGATNDAFEIAMKNNVFRVFTDLTEMIFSHTIIDLFEKVSSYKIPEIGRSFREALFVNSHDKNNDKVQFYKTAALNRGIVVEIFDDFDSAIKWLYETDKYTL